MKFQHQSKFSKTPQGLGKAKNRIKKHLPKSLHHKRELVMSLAHEYGMKSSIDSPSSNRSICEETIHKVKSYFLENSWTCPGRKDVVIVHDKKKGKEKRQKHYILTTLKEAHSSFKTENPGCKICFSKFCDMRLPEVKLLQDIPHSTFLCIYPENV